MALEAKTSESETENRIHENVHHQQDGPEHPGLVTLAKMDDHRPNFGGI